MNDPMLSEIHFNDGTLTNYDIKNLDVRPELVVLSACNTGQGEIEEGIIGLSRGFLEAGVKSVQSSLWSIDDYASSEIIKEMYMNLKKGQKKSEALRNSKLDYLSKADKLRKHPYYWAGMVHIGDDSPFFPRSTIVICYYS
jgi:CHAT domain-containing protein